MMQIKTNNPQFLSLILFTDETLITKKIILNSHNEHAWAKSNLHLTVSQKYQIERFFVRYIHDDHLIDL